jgi:predicted SprT family Zn-dependent metalloprotease
MIVKFNNFILEKIDIRNDIDLQKEYDDINKRCFNNELINVPLLWVKTKSTGGRTIGKYYRDTRKVEIEKVEISYFYELDYERFRNILAHEMIHVYVMQTHGKDYGGSHGIHFNEWMRKLNKMGFNITVKDDVTEIKMSDENDLSKALFVVLIRSERSNETRFSVSCYNENAITDEFKEKIMNTYKGDAKYTHKKYYITFIKSKDAILKKYPVKRNVKRYEGGYQISEELYNKLLDNSDIVQETMFFE